VNQTDLEYQLTEVSRMKPIVKLDLSVLPDFSDFDLELILPNGNSTKIIRCRCSIEGKRDTREILPSPGDKLTPSQLAGYREFEPVGPMKFTLHLEGDYEK